MFSLEAPQGRKKQGSNALASLTDSIHLQPAVWHNSKVQVAPRIQAKRLPRQQLKVLPPPAQGPPSFLLNQHRRAVQAALGLREEVSDILFACPWYQFAHVHAFIAGGHPLLCP